MHKYRNNICCDDKHINKFIIPCAERVCDFICWQTKRVKMFGDNESWSMENEEILLNIE